MLLKIKYEVDVCNIRIMTFDFNKDLQYFPKE